MYDPRDSEANNESDIAVKRCPLRDAKIFRQGRDKKSADSLRKVRIRVATTAIITWNLLLKFDARFVTTLAQLCTPPTDHQTIPASRSGCEFEAQRKPRLQDRKGK